MTGSLTLGLLEVWVEPAMATVGPRSRSRGHSSFRQSGSPGVAKGPVGQAVNHQVGEINQKFNSK